MMVCLTENAINFLFINKLYGPFFTQIMSRPVAQFMLTGLWISWCFVKWTHSVISVAFFFGSPGIYLNLISNIQFVSWHVFVEQWNIQQYFSDLGYVFISSGHRRIYIWECLKWLFKGDRVVEIWQFHTRHILDN